MRIGSQYILHIYHPRVYLSLTRSPGYVSLTMFSFFTYTFVFLLQYLAKPQRMQINCLNNTWTAQKIHWWNVEVEVYLYIQSMFMFIAVSTLPRLHYQPYFTLATCEGQLIYLEKWIPNNACICQHHFWLMIGLRVFGRWVTC